MAKNLTINKGDSESFTETITGIDSLSGYSAKMYIYNGGTELAAISGSISDLVITYNVLNETSKEWPIGLYKYETKIWDSSDHVFTPSKGNIYIGNTLNPDPS